MTAVDVAQDGAIRDALIGEILEFLADQDPVTLREIRYALEREIDDAGPRALVDLKGRLTSDAGWDYHPPDALVRRIHHVLADRFLTPESAVNGVEFLPLLAGCPVVIAANHLSYADANVIEVMLHRAGGAELAGRLTATAGPKVYSERRRRFSSLCFGTVKVPQSVEVSSGEAMLPAREVALAARRSIDVAKARLLAGDALLLFGEGTRSRTGRMQPMLPGVARYLEVPGTWVVPMALTGSDELFSIDEAKLRPARVGINVGAPIRSETLQASARGDRRLVMDALGLAIADLLPDECRGVYRQEHEFAAARQVLAGGRHRS